jgi:hypothetical protein
MGEYAKFNEDEVKIGTCESMYYLRYEDRLKVKPIAGNVDTHNEIGLFWRLPYPEEDNITPGGYDIYNRGERLWKYEGAGENKHCLDFADPQLADYPGTIQLKHESGLLVNAPCFHGEKLPENTRDIKFFWNGKSWSLELAFIKNVSETAIVPIVRCRHCGKMWSYSWEDVMPYLSGKLKTRLKGYAEQTN